MTRRVAEEGAMGRKTSKKRVLMEDCPLCRGKNPYKRGVRDAYRAACGIMDDSLDRADLRDALRDLDRAHVAGQGGEG